MPKSTVHLSSFALFEATATPEKAVEFCLELGLLQKFSACIRCCTYKNLSGGTIRRVAYLLQCAPSLKSVASWQPQIVGETSIMVPIGGHQHRTPKWRPKGPFRQPQHPRQSAAYDCQVCTQIWT